ncbi:MAG: glycoside hydrolase family 27 protein [Anaerolineae bacterium]|nr:glycoside hydrolase family 27 protein [Anaerolineae bacterium]
MGWNSWDCFGTSVTEIEVHANALFMAEHLLSYGWNYVVVDIQWYEPEAKAGGYRAFAPLVMDAYGRLLPAVNRFPSSKGEQGFKPLADFIHSLGLKFGIHVMRGIPRQAVERNLPIWNSDFRAQDIADVNSPCPWNTDMFGLDMSKPGAQDYYNSLLALYAEWEVDFIKADDMLFPYHTEEIAGFSAAIKHCGRAMVLSLSPGVDLTLDRAEHLQRHCEMWRISPDFWDKWDDLRRQFDLCKQWSGQSGAGHWPDADMIPIGHISIRGERGEDRHSLLTRDEQVTLMTLWAIFRSPLMLGCDLPTSDTETINLLTNPEVLAVNQFSLNNREALREGNGIIWAADVPDSDDQYIAFFNIGETETTITLSLVDMGFERECRVRDLWKRADLGRFSSTFGISLQPHASAIFRFSQ